MEPFSSAIMEQLKDVYYRFARFCPNILTMLVIILVGVTAARVIRFAVVKMLRAIKFDSWSDRSGFTSVMRRGDLWDRPSLAVGSVVFWIMIIAVLMAGISALNIQAMDSLISRFIDYVPRLLAALMILIVGYIATGFISRTVLISAVNRGYLFARLLAEAVRVLLILLFVAMALEQLQVAPKIVVNAFSIIFGGIIVSLSISFGVGGIDAARKIIEKETERKDEGKDDIEHI